MRGALAISAAVVGLAVTVSGTTTAESAPETPSPSPRKAKTRNPASLSGAATHCRAARSSVPLYRQLTWSWQERHPAQGLADRTPLVRGKSCHWARYAKREWRGRELSARKRYRGWFASTYEKWRCIHEHEGSWSAATGNGYYGGLQMDWGFQSAYGSEFLARWGHAGNWPVWAQLIAAERAYASRGFGPWPNTSRMCGL